MRLIFLVVLISLLIGCQLTTRRDGPPLRDIDVSTIPDAVPKVEPKSRYGNPHSYRVRGTRYYVLKSSRGYSERGIASWYGTKFHAQRTSSGELYNLYAMTAAHKTLPIPSYVRVTNLQNNREIIVKVNDRGPFANNRIIDLSYVAAKKLGMLRHGTALVKIAVIDPHAPQPAHKIKTPGIRHSRPPAHKPAIYLQIGAFSDLTHAKQLAMRIQGQVNVPIHIREFLPKHIFKVQLGPIASVSQTDKLSSRLQQHGVKRALVVIL